MIPGMSAAGGGSVAPDLSATSSAGDVYATNSSKQGGLTINNGLPSWALGVGVVGAVVITGVYFWKR